MQPENAIVINHAGGVADIRLTVGDLGIDGDKTAKAEYFYSDTAQELRDKLGELPPNTRILYGMDSITGFRMEDATVDGQRTLVAILE